MEGPDIKYVGDFVQVQFSFTGQIQQSRKNKVRVASVEKLKVAFVTYLKCHQSEALECQIKNYMYAREHKILWTPPYCPDLRLMEHYWTCEKNNVSQHNYKGSKMEDVIQLLRKDQYGTKTITPDTELHMIKNPVNYQKLWQKCLMNANQLFVKLCHEIQGGVRTLTINPKYIPKEVKLPIDTLIVDLTKDTNEDEEEEGLNESGGGIAFL